MMQVAQVLRQSQAPSSCRSKMGWSKAGRVNTTPLLIALMLILLAIGCCCQPSSAESRPVYKKPPFNGSIFGKRSAPSAANPMLPSMLIASKNGQWPLISADADGYELVAAIQQQDALIRTTINRCLMRLYDSTDQETEALCEDIMALRDQYAAHHINHGARSAGAQNDKR